MILQTIMVAVLLQAPAQDPYATDRAAIRAHIESIFQAFIDHNFDKVYATHSEDWVGFLPGTGRPIKGIDDYMRANGIDWPKAKGSKPNPDGRYYGMKDFEVTFYTPTLAVARFIGWFERRSGGTSTIVNQMRISDTYAKRQGKWIQVGSHTEVDPDWVEKQSSQTSGAIPQGIRQRILATREAVWRAWFTNDRVALDKLIPEDVIAIEGGSDWSHRAEILAGSKAFVDSGGKLVRLEFPKTELQLYGNIAIVYTTYLVETESGGQRNTRTGRATEMFVLRGNDLVNVGWHMDSGH
jgi:ketosteroid isomerase-like protein